MQDMAIQQTVVMKYPCQSRGASDFVSQWQRTIESKTACCLVSCVRWHQCQTVYHFSLHGSEDCGRFGFSAESERKPDKGQSLKWQQYMKGSNAKRDKRQIYTCAFFCGKLLFTLAYTSWKNFTSQNKIICGQNPFQSLCFNTKRHKRHSLHGLSWKMMTKWIYLVLRWSPSHIMYSSKCHSTAIFCLQGYSPYNVISWTRKKLWYIESYVM